MVYFNRKAWPMGGLLVSYFFLSSCTFHSQYINRKDDNLKGQSFLNRFYAAIAKNDYASLDAMTSDTLKKMSSPNAISKIVRFVHSKVGGFKKFEISDFYNKSLTGSSEETEFNYKLKVFYDNGMVDEIIAFKQSNGSPIKIYAYHANSDLLIK
jgi:hypothetical protein